jgi:hypothetical protein
MMSEIYSHGCCNLAATADVSTSNGFFTKRSPLMFLPGKMETVWTGLLNGRSIWFASRTTLISPLMVEGDPFHCRGWVLQKSCHFPRTVYFTTPQLQWGCRELSASEIWPNGNSDRSLQRFYDFSTHGDSKPLHFKRLVDQHGTGQQISKIWVRLVESKHGLNLYTRVIDSLLSQPSPNTSQR